MSETAQALSALATKFDMTNPAHRRIMELGVKALTREGTREKVRLFYVVVYDQNGVESLREIVATFDYAVKRWKDMQEHLPVGAWVVMFDLAGKSSFLYRKGIESNG